ncbi:MAG: stage III sporulation protein AC [Defluviitaleaceae bacterium]|nr:stage III sporulation protein AC [Defluviitaleaceae bacterium]
MEIGVLFQIAAVGILVAVLNQVLERSDRKEQATIVTIAGIVLVLFWIIGYIGDLFEQLRSIFNL